MNFQTQQPLPAETVQGEGRGPAGTITLTAHTYTTMGIWTKIENNSSGVRPTNIILC